MAALVASAFRVSVPRCFHTASLFAIPPPLCELSPSQCRRYPHCSRTLCAALRANECSVRFSFFWGSWAGCPRSERDHPAGNCLLYFLPILLSLGGPARIERVSLGRYTIIHHDTENEWPGMLPRKYLPPPPPPQFGLPLTRLRGISLSFE